MSRDIPLVGGAGAVIGDMLLFGGDVLVALLLSLGDIIPLLSMLSAYVAPQLAWMQEETISTLLLVAACLYIGVSIARLLADTDNDD